MRAQELASGSYRVVLSDGEDEHGKRIFRSFTADEEWKALKMASDYKKLQKRCTGKEKRKTRNRRSCRPKKTTVKTAFRNYIDTRSNVIEPTTVRNYHQIADHCFQCIMETPLTDLTLIEIQAAVNAESKRVSPKYVKNAFGLLKSVLKMHDVELKLEKIQLPKIRKIQKELPTFEEVYSVVMDTDSELPVLLAVWLSLRIGEVIGLQYRDVDLENHSIHVRRTIVLTENGYEVREGCKTEKSDRIIRIPDYILDLIMAQPHESETDFIITRTRKSVYSKFKRLMEKNGIDLTFHGLRHIYTPFSHNSKSTNLSHYPPAITKRCCGCITALCVLFWYRRN